MANQKVITKDNWLSWRNETGNINQHENKTYLIQVLIGFDDYTETENSGLDIMKEWNARE